jgi:hypothetical protein
LRSAACHHPCPCGWSVIVGSIQAGGVVMIGVLRCQPVGTPVMAKGVADALGDPWQIRAVLGTRIASASASHRRVEPSTSVKRNVTTPEGGPPADTRTGSHNRHPHSPASMSSISRRIPDGCPPPCLRVSALATSRKSRMGREVAGARQGRRGDNLSSRRSSAERSRCRNSSPASC